MDVDTSELDFLAADLAEVADNTGPFIRKAVEGAALEVKKHAANAVSGRQYFGTAAGAIDYDLKGFQGFGATVLDAEIGYNKAKRGGRLGWLIEYGAPKAVAFMNVKDKKTGKWKSVPVPGKPARPLPPGSELQKALGKTRGDFETGLEKAVDDALRRYGL